MHYKTKHIVIKYYLLREKVKKKVVNLEYVSTKEQLTDIFTKPLPKDTFEYMRGKLGVIPLLEMALRCYCKNQSNGIIEYFSLWINIKRVTP